MKIINFICREINYMNFIHRKYLINKSFKKINKLNRVLKIETEYHNKLAQDTLELIEKIKY